MAKANSNVTICDTESILGVCKPIEMEEGDGSQAKCNAKRTLVHHSTNSDNKQTFHLAMEEHNNQKQEGFDVGHNCLRQKSSCEDVDYTNGQNSQLNLHLACIN